MSSTDPFAAKRQQMREEFFAKLFLLGGWLGGTDTYKRTMWTAVPEIALQHAAYTLTFRTDDAVFRLERKKILHKERGARTFTGPWWSTVGRWTSQSKR